ncbi:metal-dependent hydrolase [Halococcus sp. AFM35]|uniref:metal-dependent hydrolase n=1 Tax=Halococcus sp. AFM35 TaxID=3421653 RepID=UPI003EBED32D
MHRAGHTGVWMLLYAPVAFTLLSEGRPEVAVLGAAIVYVVEQIPDSDQFIPFLKHRGFSHTVAFAVLVGLTLGVLGLFIGERAFLTVGNWITAQGFDSVGSAVIEAETAVNERELAGIGFGMGVFGVLAHLAGDVVTTMGIQPFWPVSSWRISLSPLKARNPAANEMMFVLGVGALAGAIWSGFGLPLPIDGTVESLFREVLREL